MPREDVVQREPAQPVADAERDQLVDLAGHLAFGDPEEVEDVEVDDEDVVVTVVVVVVVVVGQSQWSW